MGSACVGWSKGARVRKNTNNLRLVATAAGLATAVTARCAVLSISGLALIVNY